MWLSPLGSKFVVLPWWQLKQFDPCWYVSMVVLDNLLVPTWTKVPGIVQVAPVRT